jgi:ubiquinone/menaquinone biosynthesis C-methylase UbiE
MLVPDYVSAYKSHLARLIEAHGREAAMEWIVGGQYAQIGVLESSALITLGLQRNHTLVDVGCGSGRLPYTLREYLSGSFVGTDILDEALDYAREKCGRPDWQFVSNYDASIPVGDSSADFVTFFSVFTHLLDEDIYRFLAEAARVAKPGGRIVFSFLDFECESHWPIFESTVANRDPRRVINKFLSKGAIRRWARALELEEEAIHDGFQPWITLSEPFTYSDGRRAEGVVEFGQSIGVLRRRTVG